ncbi:MAG: hypothetical protein HY699_12705 [Deltaproteobacteria bacterium]|nr:hypothetical protein [Deltaproteobacteria bacterium]
MSVQSIEHHGSIDGQLLLSRAATQRAAWSFWLPTLAAAAACMLLIWALHRNSPRTLVSFHGLLHAAIAERFLIADPVFPPENPFYAGRPVCYYWFFQFLAAQLAWLCGWNMFQALEAVILVAAGALCVIAAGFGRRLFGHTAAGLLLAFLVLAGTNPAGFVFAAIKVALQGTERLQDDLGHMWGVVHPVYSLIRYNDIGGLYGPLLNFFLNLTSRPAALVTLLLSLTALEWSLHTRRAAAWSALACTSALTTAFSPIVGIAAGGALVVACGALSLRAHGVGPARWHPYPQSPSLLAASVLIALGTAAAFPTYYHLFLGPSSNQMRFWLLSSEGLKHLLTATTSVAVLVGLALLGMRNAGATQRPFLLILLLAAFMLLLADVAVVLPVWNQSNFFHAAVVMLAVPAAASIVRPGPAGRPSTLNARRAVVIVLLFLPTVALLLSAYINRPPLPLAFAGTSLQRLPQDSELARLYAWARRDTEPDAIFVLDPRPPQIAMCGNTAEFPALSGRVMFTENRRHYMVEPYPDSAARTALAITLVSGLAPSAAERSALAALRRPLYVVYRAAGDVSLADQFQRHYGEPVFSAGNILVFQLTKFLTASSAS